MRTLGRSFARLAEWQMGLLAQIVDVDAMDVEELRAVMEEVTPAGRVSCRTTSGAGTPSSAASPAAARRRRREDDGPTGTTTRRDADGAPLGVGFADIVNYTRQSRSLTRSEIARMVDGFEERALEIVSAPRRPDHQVDRRRAAVRGRRPERRSPAIGARAGRGAAARRATSPSCASGWPGGRRWPGSATCWVRSSTSPPG